MRFRTKIDWWIGAAIALALVAGPVVVVVAQEWSVLPFTLIATAVVALVCFPCDYTLAQDGLRIRSGLMRWRIPYDEIDRVYPTRNPLSSPAWSLERLAIVYGKKWVMVSPQGEREFLARLAAAARLRSRGSELCREPSKAH